MRSITRVLLGLVAALMLAMLTACGSSPAAVADLPVYPDAVELESGTSTIADTLAQNGQQDAAMREAMGIGGSTEQRGYRLPSGTDWAAVKGFYTQELKAAGWNEGMGGPGGDIAAQVLEQTNQSNDLFQTAMFSKGNQVLSVIRLADPIDTSKVELILSLSTR